jgi:outer membrane protein assembly factor BamB
VSDGKTVYASFGTGIVSAHSIDGQRKWMIFLELAKAEYGHASSPVLAGGFLIVHFTDIVVLDPATDQEVWRVPQQARHSTPIPVQLGTIPALVTAAGPVLRLAGRQPAD